MTCFFFLVQAQRAKTSEDEIVWEGRLCRSVSELKEDSISSTEHALTLRSETGSKSSLGRCVKHVIALTKEMLPIALTKEMLSGRCVKHVITLSISLVSACHSTKQRDASAN